MGPGSVVGELAVLVNEPRSATITAIDDCLLLRLRKAVFDELLLDYPEVARGVITALVAASDPETSASDPRWRHSDRGPAAKPRSLLAAQGVALGACSLHAAVLLRRPVAGHLVQHAAENGGLPGPRGRELGEVALGPPLNGDAESLSLRDHACVVLTRFAPLGRRLDDLDVEVFMIDALEATRGTVSLCAESRSPFDGHLRSDTRLMVTFVRVRV